MAKETELGTTHYLWDEENIFREADEFGFVEAQYTQSPQPFLEPYNALVSQWRDGDTSFYLFDAQGSTRALADAWGMLTDEYVYDAFGTVVSSSGTTENPYQWIGQKGYYSDADSGLYSLRRRQYARGEGRFVSEDPYGFEGGDENFYRYVGNNPVNRADPSGLDDRWSLYRRTPEEEKAFRQLPLEEQTFLNTRQHHEYLLTTIASQTDDELERNLARIKESQAMRKRFGTPPEPRYVQLERERSHAIAAELAARSATGEPRKVRERRLELQNKQFKLRGHLLSRIKRFQNAKGFERTRLRGEIRKTIDLINDIGRHIGTPDVEFDPVAAQELQEKLLDVLRRAAASGKLTEALQGKLKELATPEAVAEIVAWFTVYAALHETPLAPLLAAVDVGVTAAGGAQAATGAYLIYKYAKEAVSAEDLDFAAGIVVDQVQGPVGDAVLDLLLFVAGRQLGKRHELNPDYFEPPRLGVVPDPPQLPFRKRKSASADNSAKFIDDAAGGAPRGLDVASQAAKGFTNLECKECVAAVVKEMKAKGLSGEIIDLSTDVNRPFIYGDRLGGVISQNGTHQAVRIGDTVFDNLNPNGIPYNEWLKDLHSVQGFDIKSTPF